MEREHDRRSLPARSNRAGRHSVRTLLYPFRRLKKAGLETRAAPVLLSTPFDTSWLFELWFLPLPDLEMAGLWNEREHRRSWGARPNVGHIVPVRTLLSLFRRCKKAGLENQRGIGANVAHSSQHSNRATKVRQRVAVPAYNFCRNEEVQGSFCKYDKRTQ